MSRRLDEIDEILALLRDWFQSSDPIREKIAAYLSKKVETLDHPETAKVWNVSGIGWNEASGTKGSYLKATKQTGQDYTNMLADLKGHDGKLTKNGEFYWLFSDNETVGRKPSKK